MFLESKKQKNKKTKKQKNKKTKKQKNQKTKKPKNKKTKKKLIMYIFYLFRYFHHQIWLIIA
jgi:hypothetical protein